MNVGCVTEVGVQCGSRSWSIPSYIPATVVDQIEKTTEEPEGFCIFVTKQLLYHE